jgi:hypothetical protein
MPRDYKRALRAAADAVTAAAMSQETLAPVAHG